MFFFIPFICLVCYLILILLVELLVVRFSLLALIVSIDDIGYNLIPILFEQILIAIRNHVLHLFQIFDAYYVRNVIHMIILLVPYDLVEREVLCDFVFFVCLYSAYVIHYTHLVLH